MSILLAGLGTAQTQKKRERRQETPNERFYRKGGKSSKAEIIVQNGELITATVAQERDLSLYDDGGHSNCRAGMVRFRGESPDDFKFAYCQILKARDFIWEHWQNKRRGYIRISFDSVDAVSTAHIFVEPNPEGAWHVAWRWVRDSGEIDDLPDLRSVERRQAKREDVEHKVGTLILVFRDKEGDEIRTL
jgi:hypothetical protein